MEYFSDVLLLANIQKMMQEQEFFGEWTTRLK